MSVIKYIILIIKKDYMKKQYIKNITRESNKIKNYNIKKLTITFELRDFLNQIIL